MIDASRTIRAADAVRTNPYYAMRVRHANEIQEAFGGSYDAIYCAFRFGYAQGVKAQKAAQKRETYDPKHYPSKMAKSLLNIGTLEMPLNKGTPAAK